MKSLSRYTAIIEGTEATFATWEIVGKTGFVQSLDARDGSGEEFVAMECARTQFHEILQRSCLASSQLHVFPQHTFLELATSETHAASAVE